MDTIEAMRLLSDGSMSIFEIRSLLMSIGHSRQACADAFVALATESDSSIRIGKYQKDEFQADLFLRASQ